jgi:hypothetical protein
MKLVFCSSDDVDYSPPTMDQVVSAYAELFKPAPDADRDRALRSVRASYGPALELLRAMEARWDAAPADVQEVARRIAHVAANASFEREHGRPAPSTAKEQAAPDKQLGRLLGGLITQFRSKEDAIAMQQELVAIVRQIRATNPNRSLTWARQKAAAGHRVQDGKLSPMPIADEMSMRTVLRYTRELAPRRRKPNAGI